MTVRINHNRSNDLERSLIIYLGRSITRFYVITIFVLGSAVARYSVDMKELSFINASKQQIWKSSYNTEMKQDEYSKTRPTLKRRSYRNPAGEPPGPKTEHFRSDPSRFEDRRTGVQLKRAAKLLTVTALTTNHAVCRITIMLYPISFTASDYFPKFIRKISRPAFALNLYTKSKWKYRQPKNSGVIPDKILQHLVHWRKPNEPRQANLCLRAFRHDKF